MFRHSYSTPQYAQNYVMNTGKMFARDEKELKGHDEIPPYDTTIIREHEPGIFAEKKKIYTVNQPCKKNQN